MPVLQKHFRFKSLCRDVILLGTLLGFPSVRAQSQQPRHDSLANARVHAGADSAPLNGVAPLRVVPNAAFGVGESLTFLMHYGPVIAGNARLSVPELVKVEGRPCYKIVSELWSNKFFSSFFKIDDRVESHVDVDGLFSWRFKKSLHEGDYQSEHTVAFDQINRLAVMKKGDKSDTLAVPPFVQDVLSAIYFMRTLKLAPGDTVRLPNHSDGKLFDLQMIVHKREKAQTKAGKFPCLVVEPVLKTSGLFQQKGRLLIHVTDDQRKMPVMITSQLYVKGFKLGAIVAELEKVEGVPGFKK